MYRLLNLLSPSLSLSLLPFLSSLVQGFSIDGRVRVEGESSFPILFEYMLSECFGIRVVSWSSVRDFPYMVDLIHVG
jgi:hypothetical protein